MRKTRTQKNNLSPNPRPNRAALAQATVLWTKSEAHFQQTREYTHKKEYLSAYYNLLLATVCCKHYIDCVQLVVPEHINEVSASATAHTPKCFQKDKPVETVAYLYSLIPQFKLKLDAFQQAFGCPHPTTAPRRSRSRPDGATETGGTTPTTSARGRVVDEDCAVVQHIDLSADERPVRFSDLVGNTIAKQSIYDGLLLPVFMPLMYPQQSRAILFYGPPGTGKTMLAKATAHELNQYAESSLRVLFYAPTSDQFKGKYVGETEDKIVRLFRCASQHAYALETRLRSTTPPATAASASHIKVQSVIFIDELDSLARRRDQASGSGASIVASATNTLLQVMDGIQSYENVIVMGATNYPWNIDSAVLRRFGQKVFVPLPDEDNIVEMLQQNINQRLVDALVSRETTGHTRRSTHAHARAQAHAEFVSYTNDREQFVRTYKLHGISEDDLKVIASEMVTTRTRAGFSPRDILRVCEAFFKTESTRALQHDVFYQIRLLPEYQHHEHHHHHGNHNHLLLQTVVDTFVSETTYTHLCKQFAYAVDAHAPSITLRDDGHYPSAITELTFSVDDTGAQATEHIYTQEIHTPNKTKTKTKMNLLPPPFSVYWDATHQGYLVHRAFKMFVRNQTHFIPFFLKGHNWDPTHTAASSPAEHPVLPYSVTELLAHCTHISFMYDNRLYEYELQAKVDTVIETHWATAQHSRHPIVVDTTIGWLAQWTTYLAAPFTTTPTSLPARTAEQDTRSILDYVVHTATKPTRPTATPTDITTHTRYTYETPSPTSTPCTHLTYNVQHLLEQLRQVHPSATLKNIQALETYQQTGNEPRHT